MADGLEPVLARQPVIDRTSLLATAEWVRWLNNLRMATQAAGGADGGPTTVPVPITQGGTGATTIAGAQDNLNLQPGIDVQAYDATLAALAALTGTTNTLPYFTGTDVAALTALTVFARTLLDDPDAATARATLGLDGMTIGRTTQTATATNNAAVLTLTAMAPAGSRILGVRTSVPTAFATTNGLTGILIGDAVANDRYGLLTTLTLGGATLPQDMRSGDEPVVGASGYTLLLAAQGGLYGATGQLSVTCTYQELT